MRTYHRAISVALSGIGLLGAGCGVAVGGEALREEFKAPPAAYRPHTWWHWIDGNIGQEGITADLEAMKAAGIGGAHIFNAGSFGDDKSAMPKGPIQYNTPEWRTLMVHAMREAKRLRLEITIHNCAGWSSSGGPWVQPEDAMKRVVWSVTVVEGGKSLDVDLPKPRAVRGFYRDIAVCALPEIKLPEKPDGHQMFLTGLGGNDGGAFGELKWPVVKQDAVIWLAGGNEGGLLSPQVDGIASVKDGHLQWVAPTGRWTVLRIGYTLTGTQNVASPDSGRGLEVDKLSTECLDRFYDGGILPLAKEAGAVCGDSFTTVLIDSYETWYQNWTTDMATEFKKRRGYDLMPYLPALAGVVVEDVETTERFLFDFRRTIREMWDQNYAGHFARRLAENGLKLAVEPYGNGNFNTFDYSAPADLIMGEYWMGDSSIHWSVRLAASVAHVLGKPVVGAESLTAGEAQAGWRNHPWEWKPYADRSFVNGVNRIIYHRFTHQPWAEVKPPPGMTMGPWGSHNDRTQTWWPLAVSWNGYLTRCQFLLQSGQFVADVLVYGGEDAPLAEMGEMHGLPAVPRGYDYDVCGATQVLGAKVRDGRVVLASGMSYRVLALPAVERMSPEVAQKVRELAKAGAVIVGTKAAKSVGLQDAAKNDAEVARRIAESGIVADKPLEEVLKDIKLAPDFECAVPGVNAIHRRIGDAEVYFVASFGRGAKEAICTFRVAGRVPELWHPETGDTEDAPLWRAVKDGVEIPLRLGPAGAVFVVFQKKAGGADPIVEVKATLPAAAQAAPPPKVIKAEYGVMGDAARSKDVTQIVADALAASGEVPATNEAMGGDPAYMVVKSLRVTYVEGGKEQTATVGEHEVFRLGEVGPPKPPVWELCKEGERTSLMAWQSGEFEVRMGSGARRMVSASVPEPVAVSGAWDVHFPPGWDAPEKTTFEKLISWTDHAELGIKYFSGTAVYTKKFDVPAQWLSEGRRVVLDLGIVREIAQVKVNGTEFGTLWWPPFRVDATGALKAGENELEVRVTNLWVNRLVGDEQFPDDIGWQGVTFNQWPEWFVKGTPRPEPRRKTFTTWHHNRKDTPLIPSGLMGPVMLRPGVEYPVTTAR